MKKRIKVHGILIFISVVLIAVFPKAFFRSETNYQFDFVIRLVGYTLIVLGQLLRVCARGYKSEHSGQGSFLIQEGPYSLVRNPMYLGVLFIGLGVIIVLFRWWLMALFLFFYFANYVRLIFDEEEKLGRVFDKEYQEYRKNTPRLFPRLKQIINKEPNQIFPLRASWFKKEIIPMVLVLVSVILLKAWKDNCLFK